MALEWSDNMKLLGYALISAAVIAAASTDAAAGRRISGPYYIAHPYPFWSHRWGPYPYPYRCCGWRRPCCHR